MTTTAPATGARSDHRPGAQRVVGHRGVAEPLALDRDPRALVAGEPAEGQRDQQGQQAEVEDQVAGLLQIALLRGDRRTLRGVPAYDAPALAAQQRLGAVERGIGVVGGVVDVVLAGDSAANEGHESRERPLELGLRLREPLSGIDSESGVGLARAV